MASSFLICYPDVPVSSYVVTTSAAYDSDYPLVNTTTGMRWGYGQLAANGTSVSITYDMGTSNSRTVDHLILGGCQALKSNSVTQATLQGSNNGSTWTDQLGTASGFQTRTFNGPDGDDVIFTAAYNDQYAATLAAYRYFKVTLAGGTHKFPVSKIYFGAAFDMGKEPDNYDMEILTERDADTWRYHRGNVIMSKAFYPKHRVTVEWDGVTDAKARSAYTTLLSRPSRDHVFLYCATYQDPLYDNRLLHCRVVDSECTSTRRKGSGNWNDITMVFEEL